VKARREALYIDLAIEWRFLTLGCLLGQECTRFLNTHGPPHPYAEEVELSLLVLSMPLTGQ
jgi:hypothetical protein